MVDENIKFKCEEPGPQPTSPSSLPWIVLYTKKSAFCLTPTVDVMVFCLYTPGCFLQVVDCYFGEYSVFFF